MVPVFLVFLVVLELPGPEIRILQEISSPELAGNRLVSCWNGLSPEWLTPEWVLVLVLVVLLVVLVVLAVVS